MDSSALQRGRRRRLHLYMPWWGDNKGSISRADITSNSAADSACRATASWAASKLPADRAVAATARISRTSTAATTAPSSASPAAARDSARRLLLRDRSERRRSLGHSGAALPLHVERPRADAGEAHAGDLPRHHRRRWAARRRRRCRRAKQDYGLAAGGAIIHEAGTTRMGNDPKTSVLNAHCQAHEVKNLFVADGGPFVSQADKNLTWTIMALAWRTANHRRRAQEGEPVMTDSSAPRCCSGSAPGGRRRRCSPGAGEKAAAAAKASAGARGRGRCAPQAAVLHRARVRDGRRARRFDHPEGRSIRQRLRGGRPEFIDYIVNAQTERQVAMRGGLGWLDYECRERFDKAYLDCSEAQRRQVVDDIACPAARSRNSVTASGSSPRCAILVAAGFCSEDCVKDMDARATWPRSGTGRRRRS